MTGPPRRLAVVGLGAIAREVPLPSLRRLAGADAVRTQALMDRLLRAMGLPLEDRPGG